MDFAPYEELVLRQYVGDLFSADCFELITSSLPPLAERSFVVEVSHLSMDFAARGWMKDVASYLPKASLRAPVRSFAVGRVVASAHPDFPEGQAVAGFFGTSRYAVSDGSGVAKLDESQAALEHWAGTLGMTSAVTAYLGLMRLGAPVAGETVLVSGATGSVGSVVGQVAKDMGCRVVGFAGGSEKCALVQDMYHFDACIDYRSPDLAWAIQAVCPDGVDVYFDNAGGAILDEALGAMTPFGRVVLCGMTADRTADVPYRLSNYRSILMNRLRVEGFILFDHADGYQDAIDTIGALYASGKLVISAEDIRTGGLAAFVDCFSDVLAGRNTGKVVLTL